MDLRGGAGTRAVWMMRWMHVRPWLLLLLLPQCMSVSPHHFRQASESMQTNETDATR